MFREFPGGPGKDEAVPGPTGAGPSDQCSRAAPGRQGVIAGESSQRHDEPPPANPGTWPVLVPGSQEWFTVQGAATWLSVSPKLIYRLIAQDRTFPAVKLGGLIRIRRARFERWLDQQRRPLRPTASGRKPLATPDLAESP